MPWSEWKKFGSYSKYSYTHNNSTSATAVTKNITVPEDCTSGILIILGYNHLNNLSVSDGTGIVSKTPLFENIGGGGTGNFKMYGYNCTFNKGGTFTVSLPSSSYALDVLILY